MVEKYFPYFKKKKLTKVNGKASFNKSQKVSFEFKQKKKKNPPLENKRKKKYLTRYEINGVVWWMAQQARWSGLVVNMVRLVWCCGHVVRLAWLRERARENQIGEREREMC